MAYAYLLSRCLGASKPSEQKVSVALALLTFAGVVFRAELVLLFAPLALQMLLSGWISLRNFLKAELIAGLFSICQSIANSYNDPSHLFSKHRL